MSFWDDIGDAVSSVADTVTDVASDVGDAFGSAAEDIGSAFGEAAEGVAEGAGWFGGALADVIDFTATAVDDATFGLAGDGLSALDDYVFDPVDYLSGGLIDVDFDDGAFSAS